MVAQPTPADCAAPPRRLVACLCAAWCHICRDYQPALQEVARRFPGVELRWIDIEDESDLVDDVDVETFPTLLIADGPIVRFYGALVPHVDTLVRIIESLDGESGAVAPREAPGLAAEVRELGRRLAAP